ncbi:vascular endothelial growth factor C isoform X2 [Hippocampus comes]|uniref:vascular endothelial growth factor C isoform X2 n=1 Tax=Hippocampus comes TaxID=109280 RepID=UPI00094F2AD6|nr:PREDICTED: vascular endothelial growth factor C isoform X2 [Hippocampus comes]XP_019735352.1 PREDICTED: vascular endothelial growth factor C isoform X2 [Hippocampus comes]
MVIDHTFFDFIKMHLVEILLLLAYLMYSNFASDLSDSDYYEYDEQMHEEESDSSLPEPDMEERLRSASSVDELMSLIYPFYWAALKCKSKLPFASVSKLSHHLEPLIETDQTNFAAAYLNLDVLKSVESEWRKTQCRPREVCVDVGREFGVPTNIFYKPPCVSVYRCGGCCHSEDKQCRNISTGYLSKTLFEITVPIAQGTKPVTISVANHTQCSCLSKLDSYKQVHSIIRRSLTDPFLSFSHSLLHYASIANLAEVYFWISGHVVEKASRVGGGKEEKKRTAR